jgi:hypothetical protein
MTNSPNNQLDEFIKNSMQGHEEPFNEAHWNEFESKLNSKPRVNTFSKWSFSMNVFIGLVMFGSASVLTYLALSGSPDTLKDNSISKTTSLPSAPVTTNKNSLGTTVSGTNENVTVINTISDNSTYSIFTSADISGTNSMTTQELPLEKPVNSYTGISNTNGQLQNNTMGPVSTMNNNASGTNGNTKTISQDGTDKISPEDLKQILQDAKDANANTKALFPDMFDKKYGSIYKTKEPDTIKLKAEEVENTTPFFNNVNGKANPDSLKLFFENAEKKGDAGLRPSVLSDSTRTNNDH